MDAAQKDPAMNQASGAPSLGSAPTGNGYYQPPSGEAQAAATPSVSSPPLGPDPIAPVPSPAPASVNPLTTNSTSSMPAMAPAMKEPSTPMPSMAPPSEAPSTNPVHAEPSTGQVMQQMQSANQGGRKLPISLIAVLVIVLMVALGGFLAWQQGLLDGILGQSTTPVVPSTGQTGTEQSSYFDREGFDQTAAPEAYSTEAIISSFATQETYYRLDPLLSPDQPEGSVMYIYNEVEDELTVYVELDDRESIYAFWAVGGEGDNTIYEGPFYTYTEGNSAYIEAIFVGDESSFDKFILTRETSREPLGPPTNIVYERATLKE